MSEGQDTGASLRNEPPAWTFLLGFFTGLSLFGLGIDVMTRTHLPASIGAPICIGLMTLGMLMAIGSLGVALEGARDSDGSPEGRDADAARSRSDDSAGPQGIAQEPSA